MEPLECCTFKVEPDSSMEECQIKDEPFQDDPIEGSPIKTEPFQGDLIEGSSIKTEPLQGDLIEAYPIKIEKNQVIPIEECPTTTGTVDEEILLETPQEENTVSEDPLMPTLRQQRLDSQAKLMILNVHKYFQKLRLIRAKETGFDMNVNIEVAKATGVSESAVKRIFSEYKNVGIERAIRPATRTRKKKSDNVVDGGVDSPTVTVKKNKRKKK